MVLGFKLFAIGGLIYYFEIRRPETYLKKSRKARRWITALRWLMIVAFVAVLVMGEKMFIDFFI